MSPEEALEKLWLRRQGCSDPECSVCRENKEAYTVLKKFIDEFSVDESMASLSSEDEDLTDLEDLLFRQG